jgi:hypothetical protein
MAGFEQGIQEKSVGSRGVIIHKLEQSPKCRGSLLSHFKKEKEIMVNMPTSYGYKKQGTLKCVRVRIGKRK